MTARHDEIASALRERVASGAYKTGSKLPSEAQLARQFGASHMTVRAALGILQNAGLVEKRHGSGNYVRRPYERLTYSNDRATTDGHAAAEIALDFEVVSRRIFVKSDLSARLHVPAGTPMTEYRYQSYRGTSPQAFVRVYVPCDVTDLDIPYSSRLPLGDEVRQQLADSGVVIARSVDLVIARHPDAEEASALRINTQAVLLSIDRVSMDETGRVVEAALIALPGHLARAEFTTPAPEHAMEAAG
ncbi:GntR family transcriptional regulator [Streptomyces microflavus]|uniref:GntR family transcriptional regulator n=1 Tax=Streptomyces microflavus TaxID=1919 RepID=UPI0036466488